MLPRAQLDRLPVFSGSEKKTNGADTDRTNGHVDWENDEVAGTEDVVISDMGVWVTSELGGLSASRFCVSANLLMALLSGKAIDTLQLLQLHGNLCTVSLDPATCHPTPSHTRRSCRYSRTRSLHADRQPDVI